MGRFQVIPMVYAQQKEMHGHTHTCKDRIVSLEQSFVRLIKRGKRPNPTELGQKLHFSMQDYHQGIGIWMHVKRNAA